MHRNAGAAGIADQALQPVHLRALVRSVEQDVGPEVRREILQRRDAQPVPREHADQRRHRLVRPQRHADAVAVDRSDAAACEVGRVVGIAGVVGEVDDDVLDAELAGEARAVVVEQLAGKREANPHPIFLQDRWQVWCQFIFELYLF